MTLPAGNPVPLLQSLIRCASVTPEPAGVLDLVEAALLPLGFAVERLRFSGDGSYPVDNLIATRGGRGNRHLLFAGHTDVVPPGDLAGWTHPPFAAEIDQGLIYGRGAADMKSGVAAFIAAVARAVADGSADRGTITLAITNDEEADAVNGTEKLMAWAAGAGHRFDFAIVGEPSASAVVGDSIKVGRRGSLSGRIAVTGVQGHVAYPELARNPLPVLGDIVARLSAQRIDAGTRHFPPSNLEFTSIDVGNSTGNVIPALGSARFNIRYNDLWTPESLKDWLLAALQPFQGSGCTASLELFQPFSRAFLSAGGEGLAVLRAAIEAQTGKLPIESTAGGTSDARFIAPYCPVVECGLPGSTMHKVDEHVAIADLESLTALYAEFLRRYFAAA